MLQESARLRLQLKLTLRFLKMAVVLLRLWAAEVGQGLTSLRLTSFPRFSSQQLLIQTSAAVCAVLFWGGVFPSWSLIGAVSSLSVCLCAPTVSDGMLLQSPCLLQKHSIHANVLQDSKTVACCFACQGHLHTGTGLLFTLCRCDL